MFRAKEAALKGYKLVLPLVDINQFSQFPSGFFHVKAFGHPGMITVDRDHFDELFNVPNTDLHMMQAYLEDFHFPSVFRANIFDPVHSNAVRYKLTQNISALTPEIVEHRH